MSIRVKLALILSAGMAAATLASCLVFLRLQQRALAATEAEKVRVLLDSVSRMASESILANDPLMLLDYLNFLGKDRPEIVGFRVLMGGKWQDIGKPIGEKAGSSIIRSVSVLPPSSDEKKRVGVEVYFSSSVLAEREKKASSGVLRNLARSGALVLLLGLLGSVFLSRTLTRRILAIENALEAIGQGKLGLAIEAKGADEIGRLARGVNHMSERLKELDEMKKTFIASVTHELRSPLGAIESHVKVLLADPARWQEAERQNLERIRRNASRLEHFVTNLLEMSKIERGKLDFSPRQSDLTTLVEDSAVFFAPRAKEAQVSLDFEVEPGLPILRMDPDLISQVLANFISNAIKFTRPGGRVRVTARRADGGAECAVSDTGIGLPAEALGRIFKPFERFKNPLRATGAGLGLAISKSIVELHEGKIGATSEPGKGSRFYFILPIKAAPGRGSNGFSQHH